MPIAGRTCRESSTLTHSFSVDVVDEAPRAPRLIADTQLLLIFVKGIPVNILYDVRSKAETLV